MVLEGTQTPIGQTATLINLVMAFKRACRLSKQAMDEKCAHASGCCCHSIMLSLGGRCYASNVCYKHQPEQKASAICILISSLNSPILPVKCSSEAPLITGQGSQVAQLHHQQIACSGTNGTRHDGSMTVLLPIVFNTLVFKRIEWEVTPCCRFNR